MILSHIINMSKNNKKILLAALSAFGTMIIMLILLYVKQYAPFGNNTLAWMDADIQYLDFYSYYQDVLEGKNSLLYSFGKTLGGTNIAVFSYYLSSPFCLLVLFFDKTNLQSFFDIIVVLKLCLAAMTSCYYLLKRFEDSITQRFQLLLVLLLSVGYALCQYNIAQSSNIMWLDGVYMLPIILLLVYRIVKFNDSGWKLSLAVAYSIIANWYTAGINCFFSAFWLLFEILLSYENFKDVKERGKNNGRCILTYVSSMIVGVMISAVIFLPNISALKNSTRGSLQISNLFKNFLTGKIFSAIQNYMFGGISSYGSVALFCGSIALIGCISTFMVKNSNKYKRSVHVGIIAFGILMFYWNPLYIIFSLFKDVNSYWYRYSYMGIFIIIFISGIFYFNISTEKKNLYMIPVKSACIFGMTLLLLDYLNPIQDYQKTFKTVLSIVMIGVVLSCILYLITLEARDTKSIKTYLCCTLLFFLSIYEIQYNINLLMNTYHANDVETYREYQIATEQQISDIRQYDQGMYRITQTSTRNMGNDGITAYYNEALGYNYWSISGYTSSPDDIQRQFLDKLGYRECGENLCVVNTSILGADTLLGVKYVMSKYPIPGLIELNNLSQYNEKKIYENPYSLPMAFTYEVSNRVLDETNSFVYQNSIYSQLSGEDADLYIPLEYEVQQMGDVENGKSLIYKIQIPNGKYVLYGNMPWNSEIEAGVNVNDKYSMAYSRWLSPSVFYIPVEQSQTEAIISVDSKVSYDMDTSKAQFYALNLDRLAEITEQLRSREASNYEIKNGAVKVNVDSAGDNQCLFLSVPYDKGWSIKRNGEKISTNLVGDCLYSIPLVNGDNEIIMEYHVPYLKLGIVISIIGIFLMIFQIAYKNKITQRIR